MAGIVELLLANPIFLIPILLFAVIMVYALLKKLLKQAAIVAIAGGLYILIVAAVLIYGAYTFMTLPRTEDAEFDSTQVRVTTI